MMDQTLERNSVGFFHCLNAGLELAFELKVVEFLLFFVKQVFDWKIVLAVLIAEIFGMKIWLWGF